MAEVADTATRLSLDRMIALRTEAVRAATSSLRGITQMPGLARTRLRGRGLDFDELRPYAQGDDVRHIDWKVTARTGKPYTRLYREERERAVTVAVDMRQSMFTGSQRLKAVVAGEVAASLLWRVAANQDRAGALVFDDNETRLSRPGLRERGALNSLGLIDEGVLAARAQMGKFFEARELSDVIAEINELGGSAGMIVLITGCDDPGDGLDAGLSEAARRERLVVLRLFDPIEAVAPQRGRYFWRSGAHSELSQIDAAASDRAGALLAEANRALAGRFEMSGVPFVQMAATVEPSMAWTLLAEHGVV